VWRNAPLYFVGLFCARGSSRDSKLTAEYGQTGTRRRLAALLPALAFVALAGLTTALWPRPYGPKVPEGAPGFLRVTDDTGRAVAVPQPVRRIVSLAPNLTETLFALGLGDRVVGVTDFCDYPAEAATREHVGGPVSPNLEKIAKLRPDLVLATRSGGNRLATVQSLETLGITVFATDPHTVDEVIASAERMGEMTGAGDQGRTLAEGLRRRLNDVAERVSGSKIVPVLLVVWPDPLITIGRNTFIADALRRAGAENVIQTAQDWPNASLEEVARRHPQYLVFASDHSEESNRQIAELSGRSGWRGLEAVRDGHIIVLSESIARPAPRLVDEIEQLARALHPERFPLELTGVAKGTQ
jgi:iron complex transport system substrate-binding protein